MRKVRRLAAVLTLCVLLAGTGCGTKVDSKANPDGALVNKSIALGELMVQKADSNIASVWYGVSMAEVEEYALQVADMDIARPQAAWVFGFNAESFLEYMAEEVDDLDLPEDVINAMMRQVTASLPNFLAGQMGQYYIVFSSVISAETAFVKPAGFGDTTIVLLVYDGEFATLTSFVEYEDGVLVARSSIVPDLGFADRNAVRELDKVLQEVGQRRLDYRIYEGDELETLLNQP